MPGSLDGQELAQAIRHRWPPLALSTARPWRLVELGLVDLDLPYAARALQESQCHRPADRQQIMRPDRRHAAHRTVGLCSVGRSSESGPWQKPIAPTLIMGRHDSDGVTARTIDVQFQAVAADSAYALEGKSHDGTPRSAESPYVRIDSTLRHASAQQCWQRLNPGLPEMKSSKRLLGQRSGMPLAIAELSSPSSIQNPLAGASQSESSAGIYNPTLAFRQANSKFGPTPTFTEPVL
jgi:hypothetical protein